VKIFMYSVCLFLVYCVCDMYSGFRNFCVLDPSCVKIFGKSGPRFGKNFLSREGVSVCSHLSGLTLLVFLLYFL
jgi:hypothetical protein